MSRNEQVHRPDWLSEFFDMCSDLAIVKSRLLIEGLDFEGSQKSKECLPILLWITAFGGSILEFTDRYCGNYEVRRTKLLHLLDYRCRMLLDDVDANIRVQQEEHHITSPLCLPGEAEFFLTYNLP